MKRKIGVLLILFIALTLIFGAKIFATNICKIEFVSNINSPKRGDEIEIVVSIKDLTSPVAGISYAMSYDDSVFEAVGQVESLNNYEVTNLENTYFIYAPNYEAVETDQAVCKFKFKVKDSAALGESIISFNNLQIVKEDYSIENLDDINLKLDIKQKDLTLNVTYSTKEKTNNNVLVTITSDVELQEKQGWNRANEGKTLTKEYSENIQENIVVTDLYGNQATVAINIDNIDKQKPVITANNIIYGNKLNIRLQDAQSGVVAWQLNNNQEEPVGGWTDIELTNDYTLELEEVNAGTYYIWAKDKAGNIKSTSVTVTSKDITPNDTGITKTLNNTLFVYDGTEIQPKETLMDGTKELIKGIDYSVTYQSNTNAGVGKVIITGIGNYKETITLEFTISKKSLVVEWNNVQLFTYNGEYQVPTLKYIQLNGVNNEKINLEVTGQKKNVGTNYTAVASISSVTGGNANKNNYELVSANKQFEIMPKQITVNSSNYDDFYDEQAHGIELTVVEPTTDYQIYYKIGSTPLTMDNYTTGSTTNPKKTEVGEYTIQWYVHATTSNYSDISGSNQVIIKEVQKATGDMNENEGIDIGDILILLRHIAQANDSSIKQKHPQWELATEKVIVGDMNKNGVIDLGDILKLRRYMSAKNSNEVAAAHPDWLNL